MQKKAKKALVLTLGIVFIILGLVGLVLPFLQGILFLIIGLLLLSLCLPSVRAQITRHTEKHTHLSSKINAIEAWLAKFIGEI